MAGFQFSVFFAVFFQNFLDIHFLTITHPVLFLTRTLLLTLPMYCKLSSNCQNYFTPHLSLFPINLNKIKALAFSSAYMHTDLFNYSNKEYFFAQLSKKTFLSDLRATTILVDTISLLFSKLKHSNAKFVIYLRQPLNIYISHNFTKSVKSSTCYALCH